MIKNTTSSHLQDGLAQTALVVLTLLVPGCSNEGALLNNDRAVATSTATGELTLTSGQIEIQKQINAKVLKVRESETATKLAKLAFANYLFDPGSASFSNIRMGRNGAACGKVNAKNRYGAYVGFKDFVAIKGGEVYLSSYNDGLETETNSVFATTYLANCASKEARSDYLARTAPVPNYDSVNEDASEEPDAILDAPVRPTRASNSSSTT